MRVVGNVVVLKCLRKTATIPALLGWFFCRQHDISNKRGEEPTLGGSGRISRYNRRSLSPVLVLLRIASTARKNTVRNNLRRICTTRLMKIRSQECTSPVVLFCSGGWPIPITGSGSRGSRSVGRLST